VGKLEGQIYVTSEQSKGNTFNVELPFYHALPSAHTGKPRKLRNLFLQSGGPPKAPAPSTAPPMKSPNQKSSQRLPPSPGPPSSPFPPRINIPHSEEDHDVTANGYLHALGGHVAEDLSTPADTDQTDDLTSPASARLNILIAEDNPLNARAMDKELSLRGHTVAVASDGQECHDWYAANPAKFDVILMDMKVCVPSTANMDRTYDTDRC
jgi:CheY-like chemotaxis protein